MNRVLRVLGPTVVIAALGAGCSTGTDGSGGSDGGSGADDVRRQAASFAACMRDHGVGDFPDPDASGELTVDQIANETSIDTDGAAWKAALDACEDLEPPGFTGETRSPDQQDAALLFAACMRDHGVSDFPDPLPDGPLVDTNRIPSTSGEGGMAALDAAMASCGEVAADDLGVSRP